MKNVVSVKDIEEIYGKEFVVDDTLANKGGRKTKINKDILDDYLEVTILNEIGPYATLRLSANDGHRFIMPVDKILKMALPTPYKKFKPVLDGCMPNRWRWDERNGTLILYYPELTLTNSMNTSHTIYDLVVKTRFSGDGLLTLSPQGKRYSFSEAEIKCGYAHSHLSTWGHDSNAYKSFCLGSGTPFGRLISLASTSSLSTKQFELFLIQLEEYLKWESLEGKPHISMTKIWDSASSNGNSDHGIEDPAITKCAIEFINILTEYPDAARFMYARAGIVDPTLDSKRFFDNVERKLLETYKTMLPPVLWDNKKMSYVYSSDPLSNTSVSLPGLIVSEDDHVNITHFKIDRRIIKDEVKQEEEVDLIDRIPRNHMQIILKTVNKYLINSVTNE